MENEFELGAAFEKLIKSMNRAKTLIDGVITQVNDDFTCDVEILEVPFSNVPVKVLIGSRASIYEVPVVGSKCLVTFRDSDMQRPQITMVDQVDKYYINVGGMVVSVDDELDITANETVFNGGSNHGMMLLIPSLQAINKLQNDINTLKQDFSGWVPVPNDGGAALKAATATWAGTPIPVTSQSDIENLKIKQ